MYEYNTARATLEKVIGKNLANGEVELNKNAKIKTNKSKKKS